MSSNTSYEIDSLYNAQSQLQAVIESYRLVARKHEAFIHCFRDDFIQKIENAGKGKKLQPLNSDLIAVEMVNMKDRNEDILISHLDEFYIELIKIQKDLGKLLIDTCERLMQMSSDYKETSQLYRIELETYRREMEKKMKNELIQQFQSNRLQYLKKLVDRVQKQSDDALIINMKKVKILLSQMNEQHERNIQLDRKYTRLFKKVHFLKVKLSVDPSFLKYPASLSFYLH